jgi:hypothetical protein
MRKLLAERLTGLPQVTYSNANMDRGTELEPEARKYYADLNGCTVVQVGFIEISEDVGVSPDGLIGDDGGLEIKCPLPSTHISYILGDREIACYRPQVQGCMWATGRKWIDFVSYCPDIKDRPIWTFRVARDEKFIAELEVKVGKFVTEMKSQLARIQGPQF